MVGGTEVVEVMLILDDADVRMNAFMVEDPRVSAQHWSGESQSHVSVGMFSSFPVSWTAEKSATGTETMSLIAETRSSSGGWDAYVR